MFYCMKVNNGNHYTVNLTDLTNSTTAFFTTLPTTICIVFLVTSEGTPIRTCMCECVCVCVCVCVFVCMYVCEYVCVRKYIS